MSASTTGSIVRPANDKFFNPRFLWVFKRPFLARKRQNLSTQFHENMLVLSDILVGKGFFTKEIMDAKEAAQKVEKEEGKCLFYTEDSKMSGRGPMDGVVAVLEKSEKLIKIEATRGRNVIGVDELSGVGCTPELAKAIKTIRKEHPAMQEDVLNLLPVAVFNYMSVYGNEGWPHVRTKSLYNFLKEFKEQYGKFTGFHYYEKPNNFASLSGKKKERTVRKMMKKLDQAAQKLEKKDPFLHSLLSQKIDNETWKIAAL